MVSVPPVRTYDASDQVCSIDAGEAPMACLESAEQEGVTVLELFGGMAAGVEMLLRNGVPITRYVYCDNSPAA